MARTGLKLDRGWKKWEKAISPRRMEAAIRNNMRTATKLNGKLAERTIRQVIRAGKTDRNADLTIMIKSSSKPLVDQGTGLFQAITSHVIDDQTVFAGVLRTDGDFNIAMALHKGVTINVSPAMRGMFFFLWQASIGAIPESKLEGRAAQLWERSKGGWLPLKPSTSKIVIPGRPFMREAFANTRIRSLAKRNWQQALQKAMRELARG